MTISRLHPNPAGPFPLDDERTWELVRELYTPLDRRTVRINMIASVNGSAVGEDGTSESLSNRVDRRILGIIRDAADVVVVGARTVRREGYLGPANSPLAVVTLSGDLRGHRLHDAALPSIILCPASAAARVEEQLTDVAHEVVTLESDVLDAGEIIAALRARGLESVVCEGGPTLAAAFLDAGLVDEVCLTTSPKLRSPGTPLFARLASTPAVHLAQLLLDGESTLYARWLLSD